MTATVNPGNLPAILMDPATFGPAMLDLTEKQQRYVIALLETGGTNETQAALMAGYGTGYETRAYELSRNPKVLAALREEADKRLRSGALLAASKLIEIAMDKQHKDQFKACTELLNRGGLIVQTQHKLIIEDTRSDDEVIKRVASMAKSMGMDPKAVLANVGVEYVDAEFTEATKQITDQSQKVSESDTLSETDQLIATVEELFSLEDDDDE